MITNETIQRIIEAGAAEGYEVSVKDISKAILARHYEDWGNISKMADTYFATKQYKWLSGYLSQQVFDDSAMTFDDNKKAIIKLIEKTQRDAKNGLIDPDKAIKLEGDLRVKLNDKFNVQSEVKDKVVVVEKKYNMVCRHGYECYLPSKDELMEMYGLVEKDK